MSGARTKSRESRLQNRDAVTYNNPSHSTPKPTSQTHREDPVLARRRSEGDTAAAPVAGLKRQLLVTTNLPVGHQPSPTGTQSGSSKGHCPFSFLCRYPDSVGSPTATKQAKSKRELSRKLLDGREGSEAPPSICALPHHPTKNSIKTGSRKH